MFFAKTRSAEIPWFIAYLLLLFASHVVADLVVWPYVVTRYITNPYLEPLVRDLATEDLRIRAVTMTNGFEKLVEREKTMRRW
jgi:hypothetical protein